MSPRKTILCIVAIGVLSCNHYEADESLYLSSRLVSTIAAAAGLYEAEKGAVPEKLADVEQFMQPFYKERFKKDELGNVSVQDSWGSPISFERKDHVIRIWSWGPNLTNDLGGKDDIVEVVQVRR